MAGLLPTNGYVPVGRKRHRQGIRMMRCVRFIYTRFICATFSATTFADGKNPTYVDDVLPVLRQSCTSCHGDDKQKGGLNLASFGNMQQGGSSGAVVTAGDPDKSRLYLLMAHKDE